MPVTVHFYPFDLRRGGPRNRRTRRRRQLFAAVAALLGALALAPLLAAHAAPAQPQRVPRPAPGTQRMDVTVRQATASITPTSTLAATVTVDLARPAPYVEVRVRMRSPGGRLVYQKTEIRREVASATVDIGFRRPAARGRLPEGRYPLEIRVSTTGSDPETVDDRVLVVPPGAPTVPLAVVLRFTCSPGVDPAGHFVVDPAENTRARDQAVALATVLARRTPVRLSLAVPPVMLDEWRRIGSGYQVVGPDGLRSVEASDPVSVSYRRALTALRASLATGRAELLDVPYAEPDMSGLQRLDAVSDLALHYAHSESAYLAALGTTPTVGTSLLGDALPVSAVPVLSSEGVRYAVVATDSVTSEDGTVTPGAYRIERSKLSALVIDEDLGGALGRADTATAAVIDTLYARLASDQPTRPVTAVVEVGPGSAGDVRRLSATLRSIDTLPWVRLVSASQAAGMRDAPVRLTPRVPSDGAAPPGYWQDVARGRDEARGLLASAEPDDADALNASLAVLVAESRCWAGPDERWALADRGRAYAAAGERTARRFLGKVTLSVSDLTLSGQSGKVPVSIGNDSGKPLRVVVTARGEVLQPHIGTGLQLTLRPAENYLTIPVDLGSALADRLTVRILAGDLVVAQETVTVRASYIDRLAIVGTVVVVLLGLLFYIRRRVIAAQRGTG